ncbi:TorF family putative porin [Sphingomonas sp. IC081]|uniref:TorF family putative porin n=1 Tax=Sphingomonas sp. IC081 TaxID=304378 RepID=UPI00115C282B|nr:TorF family putative porin [Sphingomonas sp. IC081]QDK31560.1 hypothetical protein DM450_01890 [Sphingomonas sp. IC081]
MTNRQIAAACLAAALSSLACAPGASAQDAAAGTDGAAQTPAPQSATPQSATTKPASDLSVSVTLKGTTDYVWRGVSQSDNDPAVFAVVNLGYKGFYLGAETENVRFAGIKQEWDMWGGYVARLGGGVALDVGFVRYGYVDAPVDIDTFEVKAALSGKVGPASVSLAGYHTWDYFGTGENATYVELGASAPVMDKLSISAAAARQQIDHLSDYTTWNAGLSYQVLPGASVDLRYYDTDLDKLGRLSKARVVGAFTVTF